MTITIGGQVLAISRPGDLDAQLLAATGCNAAEHAAMLGRPATGFQIARVLAPMLKDGEIGVRDLAALIDAGDRDAVRCDVVALLAPSASLPAKAKPKDADDGQA